MVAGGAFPAPSDRKTTSAGARVYYSVVQMTTFGALHDSLGEADRHGSAAEPLPFLAGKESLGTVGVPVLNLRKQPYRRRSVSNFSFNQPRRYSAAGARFESGNSSDTRRYSVSAEPGSPSSSKDRPM